MMGNQHLSGGFQRGLFGLARRGIRLAFGMCTMIRHGGISQDQFTVRWMLL